MFLKRGTSHAICRHCKQEYVIRHGNTSTLRRHAMQKHPDDFKKITTTTKDTQQTLMQAWKKPGN